MRKVAVVGCGGLGAASAGAAPGIGQEQSLRPAIFRLKASIHARAHGPGMPARPMPVAKALPRTDAAVANPKAFVAVICNRASPLFTEAEPGGRSAVPKAIVAASASGAPITPDPGA